MQKHIKKHKLTSEPAGFFIPLDYVKSSNDAAKICRMIHQQEGNDIQEFFYVVFLNRANRITGFYIVSMGGITGTVADPRLIFKAAILADCTNILLCHNHPSGNTKPSRADEELTQKIKAAGTYADIKVLDHIILGEEEAYFSFADDGLI